LQWLRKDIILILPLLLALLLPGLLPVILFLLLLILLQNQTLVSVREENSKYFMNRFLNKYSSAVRVIKLRIIKWVTNVARMGKVRNTTKLSSEKLEERPHGRSRCRTEDKSQFHNLN
jgi:hypothetical protein